MAKRTFVERIEILEQDVTKLNGLSSEVAALRLEFSQFREENRREHLAIRTELRAEFRAGIDEAKRHALVLHEHLVDLIKTIRNG